jgi:hypothetical protein
MSKRSERDTPASRQCRPNDTDGMLERVGTSVRCFSSCKMVYCIVESTIHAMQYVMRSPLFVMISHYEIASLL